MRNKTNIFFLHQQIYDHLCEPTQSDQNLTCMSTEYERTLLCSSCIQLVVTVIKTWGFSESLTISKIPCVL